MQLINVTALCEQSPTHVWFRITQFASSLARFVFCVVVSLFHVSYASHTSQSLS